MPGTGCILMRIRTVTLAPRFWLKGEVPKQTIPSDTRLGRSSVFSVQSTSTSTISIGWYRYLVCRRLKKACNFRYVPALIRSEPYRHSELNSKWTIWNCSAFGFKNPPCHPLFTRRLHNHWCCSVRDPGAVCSFGRPRHLNGFEAKREGRLSKICIFVLTNKCSQQSRDASAVLRGALFWLPKAAGKPWKPSFFAGGVTRWASCIGEYEGRVQK